MTIGKSVFSATPILLVLLVFVPGKGAILTILFFSKELSMLRHNCITGMNYAVSPSILTRWALEDRSSFDDQIIDGVFLLLGSVVNDEDVG